MLLGGKAAKSPQNLSRTSIGLRKQSFTAWETSDIVQ